MYNGAPKVSKRYARIRSIVPSSWDVAPISALLNSPVNHPYKIPHRRGAIATVAGERNLPPRVLLIAIWLNVNESQKILPPRNK